MNQQKIEKVFSDEVFVNNLLGLETAEEVQAALHAKGLEFTLEDIYKIRDALIHTNSVGELSDHQLEEVAGGIVITALIGLILAGISTGCSVISTVHRVSDGRW